MASSLKSGLGTSGTVGSQQPTEHRVIQCPACQTKFAIKVSLLADFDAPRFHCSRCDHVFGNEEIAPPSPVRLVRSSQQTLSTAKNSVSAVAARDPFEGELQSSDLDSPVHAEGYRSDVGVSASALLTRTRDEFRSIEIPRKPDGLVRYGAPHENLLESATQTEFPFANSRGLGGGSENFGGTANMGSASSSSHSSVGSSYGGLNQTAVDLLAQRAAKHELLEEDETPIGSRELLRGSPANSLADEILSARARFRSSISARMSRSPWSGTPIFALPLVGFVLVLIVVGYLIQSKPHLTLSLQRTLLPSAPESAPAELMITKSRLTIAELSSGERVHLVSGAVVNGSEQTFSQVIIQATAFDRSGNPIAEERANLAATLAKARIRSLTPAMMRNIQSEQPSSHFELKPREKLDFTIAFLGDSSELPDLSTLRSFNTRVYSVSK